MPPTLFTNVNVLDGTGALPYPGQVLVEGERIKAVARAGVPLAAQGISSLDCGGATLMPGLVESHAHLSFTDIVIGTDLGRIPPEEHTLQTMRSARTLLEHGFTSCFSAASAKPRLDVVVRDAIDAGDIPGPRLLAASPELTVTSGLGDARRRHISQESFALVCDGPDQFRRTARALCREGVDTLKINPSGDTFLPHSRSRQTVMTEAEVAAVCEVAHAHDLRTAAHARSAAAIKLALRHGVEVIYHANFADDEACELLEAARERVFVAPTLGATLATLERAPAFGRAQNAHDRAMLEQELAEGVETARKLKRRGVRVLPGGDYGFAWNPNGSNARDLEVFVKVLGFTPMEAILAATKFGGELMRRGHELGQIRTGYLADLLLVDGDPLADVSILQDERRLLGIVKGGVFFKTP
ncbi:MAG TPA: amidohydrolase family protein [Burkholderiales bacterium]|nr:amidohydrolase family protein [Burkholderiales bacterium]